MAWRFLPQLTSHSVCVGRKWFISFFFFRLILVTIAAGDTDSDLESNFRCNTGYPACQTACYYWFSPLSLLFFWVLELIVTATASALFLGFNLLLKDDAELQVKRCGIIWDGLMKIYALQLVSRLLLEASFLVGQFTLDGFEIAASCVCSHSPCLQEDDCSMSRPTEKTALLRMILGASCLSLMLLLLELAYVAVIARRCSACRSHNNYY